MYKSLLYIQNVEATSSLPLKEQYKLFLDDALWNLESFPALLPPVYYFKINWGFSEFTGKRTFDNVEQNARVVNYTLESYIIILFIYMEKIYMAIKVSAPIQGWQIHGILVHGSVDKLEDGISLYDGFHSVYIYIYISSVYGSSGHHLSRDSQRRWKEWGQNSRCRREFLRGVHVRVAARRTAGSQ